MDTFFAVGKNVGVVFMQTSKFCLPTGYLVSLSLFLPLYTGDRYPPQGGRGGGAKLGECMQCDSELCPRQGRLVALTEADPLSVMISWFVKPVSALPCSGWLYSKP